MPRYRISITSKDPEAMLDLVRKHRLKVFDHGNRYSDADGYTVGGIAEPATIEKLKAAGYHVEQHEDVDRRGKERQKEVGKGDRYKKTGQA
jgi:hypothetical protein